VTTPISATVPGCATCGAAVADAPLSLASRTRSTSRTGADQMARKAGALRAAFDGQPDLAEDSARDPRRSPECAL
jgi:hypothetical protein